MENFTEMLNFEVEDMPKRETENGITEMELSKMESFPEHKFKLYEGKRFDDMVESIREFGILMPIILWKKEEHYIILSGHNRVNCGKVAGLIKAPVIIKEDLSYDEATLIAIETNLCQRSFSDLSESEKAYSLYQHYIALKSQGKRSDLILEVQNLLNPNKLRDCSTSAEISRSSDKRQKLAEEYQLSRDQLVKYIRVGEYLESNLMQLLDKKVLSLSIANTLSFIVERNKQNLIAKIIKEKDYKVDGKKAELLRQYYENRTLTEERIEQILSGEKTRKPPSSKVQPVKIKATIVSKYFSKEQSQKEIEEVIDKALALYFAEEYGQNENIGS